MVEFGPTAGLAGRVVAPGFVREASHRSLLVVGTVRDTCIERQGRLTFCDGDGGSTDAHFPRGSTEIRQGPGSDNRVEISNNVSLSLFGIHVGLRSQSRGGTI